MGHPLTLPYFRHVGQSLFVLTCEGSVTFANRWSVDYVSVKLPSRRRVVSQPDFGVRRVPVPGRGDRPRRPPVSAWRRRVGGSSESGMMARCGQPDVRTQPDRRPRRSRVAASRRTSSSWPCAGIRVTVCRTAMSRNSSPSVASRSIMSLSTAGFRLSPCYSSTRPGTAGTRRTIGGSSMRPIKTSHEFCCQAAGCGSCLWCAHAVASS
jgi:hypothetical protein